MIKDLRDWKKESERKNKNKHQWGWFQHPNAGNVEYNIDFFNHVTGADGGDTSVLAGSVGDGGMGESLDMNDKVELYYDDIEVSGYYGPTDWETGYPKKEYNETIDWEYKVDRDDIFVDLEEFIEEESPELSDEELEKIVSENFEELVDKYYQQLLDKYRKRAEEDANENYEYDEYDHYLDAMGESVNIREALNKIDCNTCGKYDLLNMYDCSDMPLEKKAKLAEMLKENVSADKLYEYMDEESPWQIGLELFADNGHEYKVISVLDEREVDGYELSIVGAIGNELSNADEEVYFVLLDSDIEWGPVDTAQEAIEWASDVRDGYYNDDDEDDFDSDDDIDFIDLYGVHDEYDEDYGVQERHSMNEDTEDDERVKTFKLNGIIYKISKLEDSLGNGGYVARWEDDSDNGLGYNNRGWISFDKKSYVLHNEASKPIKDFMYVISAYDRQPKQSAVDKLIATTISMFGDDAVDTDSAEINEDTVKTKDGKWANVGKDGKVDSGKFKTKKEADAQRRAMFANGYKGESLEEDGAENLKEGWETFRFSDYDDEDVVIVVLTDKRFSPIDNKKQRESLRKNNVKILAHYLNGVVVKGKVGDIKNVCEDCHIMNPSKILKESLSHTNVESLKEFYNEYGLENATQEYTSANTSINSTKLPAIFSMVRFEPETINLDYGGGKFDNATAALEGKGVTNLVYDPYNRSSGHNKDVIDTIRKNGGADTATCSNVLNVIKEPAARTVVIKNIYKLLKPNGVAYFTVYEGTGKGDEGPTKAGYQLNKKTADYVEEISSVFPSVSRRGKLIVASKGTSITEELDDENDIKYTATGRKKMVSDETMSLAVEAARTIDPNAKGDYDDDFIYGDDGHGGSTWVILLDGDGKAYSTWGRNAVLTSKVEKAVNDAADAYWADFDKRQEEIKKACRRGNAMNEGTMKEIDLEVQEAGGVDAYIDSLESQLRKISREMRFLRGQARREMKAGGAYDSVDEINDALKATVKEYNEVRKKYDYISSQQTGGVN